MKNCFKLLIFFSFALTVTRCSQDDILEQNFNEQATHAALYADQFLTVQVTTNSDRTLNFQLVSDGGRVSINWGDGTIEKRSLGQGQITSCSHTYSSDRNYTVNISGEIQTITRLTLADEELLVNKIHFGGLPNLKRLELLDVTNSPSVINLSRNKELNFIKLAGLKRLQDVILSTTNKISYIEISADNSLTTAVVNRVIARIHDSVINNPRSGTINLKDQSEWSEQGSLIGPPSDYAMNKLRKLKNSYGWTVLPELENQIAFAIIVPDNTIQPGEKNYGFAIDFTPPMKITIDWGDGTVQNAYITDRKFADFSHEYAGDLSPIKISGDLGKIFHFSNDAAGTIKTGSLYNLRELSVYAGSMTNFDLSSNIKLEKLTFFNSTVQRLTLPTSHSIKSATFDEDFVTSNVDEIITNLHSNAVNKNLRSGTFYFLNTGISISSTSIAKLKVLQEQYLWFIDIGDR